jgi:hypothetical protein
MIVPDPKKVATVVLSRMGKEGSTEVKPEESLDDDEAGLDTCCEEIFAAIDSESALDLKTALKSFIDQYSASEVEED